MEDMAHQENRYVALLRGINVGGNTIIRMADLRGVVESLGYTAVATYIQTGNVVFSSAETDPRRLAEQLEQALAPLAGREVVVFLLTPQQLKDAAARNPFRPERGSEQRSHLLFLSAEPEPARWEALQALKGEEYRFHLDGRVLYYAYGREWAGRRRTIDFEKVLGVRGTARSWNVVDRLIKLAGGS